MRFLHTSDWHLGKLLNGRSLIEDQKFFIDQVFEQLNKGVEENNPYAAILLSGDIYDRSIPPEEATVLFSDFLSQTRELFPDLHLFIISGNHDSASRLSFAAGVLNRQNIHITGNTKNFTTPYILQHTVNGKTEQVAVYQLPYLTPRSIPNIKDPDSYITHQQELYEAACSQILDMHNKNYKDLPSVICAHLFTLGSIAAGSERSNVGDSEQVSADVFDGFTYGAFGHIHGYHVCDKNHRCYYSGSPLAYHIDDNPETCMLDVTVKGTELPEVVKIPVKPLHPLIQLEGKISDFTNLDKKWDQYKNHYVHICLTDEVMVPNAHEILRPVFPFLISVKPKERLFSGKTSNIKERKKAMESRDIEVIFDQFISDVYGENAVDSELMTAEKRILKELAAKIKWGENR